jgi:uncharacterized membrane protein YccC
MNLRLGRIGKFLFFIGVILLVIFFATDPNKISLQGFLFFGLGLTLSFLGVYLIWRDWKPTGENKRFRMLRRMRKKDALDKKESEKKK